MRLTHLKCNNCGANLPLPDSSVRYLSCTHCGSSLAIKREGNAAYTQVLEQIQQDTVQLVVQSEVIATEQALARLDREWHERRAMYLVEDKRRGLRPPDWIDNLVAVGVSVFLLATAGLASWLALLDYHAAIRITLITLFVFGLLWWVRDTFERKSAYERANRAYEAERAKLLARLER